MSFVGCLERIESDSSASAPETLGERPFPRALVGDDAYVDDLERRIEQRRFPEPDASLLPEVTKARFVADAARDAGSEPFARRIERLREPLFEPFYRFELLSLFGDEQRRDELAEDEIDEALERAGLDDENVTLEDDRETVVETAYTDRDLTFADYPAPPLHVIEGAASRGRELLDETPDERAASVDDERRPYVRQRAQIEAVVAGARELAAEAYDEVIDRIREESPSNRTYEDAETYAEVVAFNAALASEAMLEEDGELTTPP